MVRIRKMIGDVPAYICSVEGTRIFELRTDGKVKWVRPDMAEDAADMFCDGLKISEDIREEVKYKLKEGQIPMQLMHKIFPWETNK